MKLIVGIGNPGPRYEGTRHNVGFEVVDRLAREVGVSFRPGRCQALEASFERAEGRVLLAKPSTFVNLSGLAVAGLASWYKLTPCDLLVVLDCVHLSLGKLRVRAEGSAGGHKGLASIIESLGTGAFARLRIGVGSSPGGAELSDHVLSRFEKEERGIVDLAILKAAEAVCCWTRGSA